MPSLHDIDTIVFDILGTLVDDTAGLRTALSELVPDGERAPAGRRTGC